MRSTERRPEVRIRPFQARDAAALATLFFETVRETTGAHYDAAQRAAWAPTVPETRAWRARLAYHDTLVAERESRLAGFMALTSSGHVELAYVAKRELGSGVGRALLDAVTRRARARGLTTLTTDASEVARPFFERRGWRLVQRRYPLRGNVVLPNYRMQLDLGGGRR